MYDLETEEHREMRRINKILVLAAIISLVVGLAAAFAGGSKEQSQAAGGQAKKYKIVTVYKVSGEPWFNRMGQGVKVAAEELGVDAYGTGPTTADAAAQVRVVNDVLNSGVNAICIDPDDAQALVPALERAKALNITVITTESPGQKGADYDLEQIYNDQFGRDFWDAVAKYAGPNANYAIFVGSLTVPLHNLWADVGLKYAKEKYPNMHLVTKRLPVGEDQAKAKQATLELLTAYPNLDAIIGFGSLGPLGAAQALEQTGKVGKVKVIGTVVPSQGAQYIKSGGITESIAWDPKWGGYGMTWLAKHILDGKKVTNDMKIPHLGTATLKDRVLRYDGVIRVNKNNIADYMSF